MKPELQTFYENTVLPALREELGCKNIHEVPRIEKVVINCCVGSAADRSQAVEDAVNELTTITGQKPVVTVAKKSVSNFKLREGQEIGCKVTLRRLYMWEFLSRLINTAIPRIRDFRGISPKAFDGNGNYTLGITDQTIFPEIELDKVKRNLGFDITIVTTADNNEAAYALLDKMGMPFRKPAKAAAA